MGLFGGDGFAWQGPWHVRRRGGRPVAGVFGRASGRRWSAFAWPCGPVVRWRPGGRKGLAKRGGLGYTKSNPGEPGPGAVAGRRLAKRPLRVSSTLVGGGAVGRRWYVGMGSATVGPACWGLSGTAAWPNRACSGRGCAAGQRGRKFGQKSCASRGVGRRRRAADAIVRPRVNFGKVWRSLQTLGRGEMVEWNHRPAVPWARPGRAKAKRVERRAKRRTRHIEK